MGLAQVQHGLRSALAMIYPSRCLSCGGLVEQDAGLCPDCWKETPFISGLACDSCGTPLPGQSNDTEFCDSCLADRPPWTSATAALAYEGVGRRLVLGLKHGDRYDIADPAGRWMAQKVRQMQVEAPLICPVPLHTWRHVKRRFNQSALLARVIAEELGYDYCPDALIRVKRTQNLDGKSRGDRYGQLANSMTVNERRRHLIENRNVLIVDDVMTSGATLSACCHAFEDAFAAEIHVCVLARVAPRP